MLQLSQVQITYGVGVIAAGGVSLEVGDGKAVTIIGGAGKSTVLKAASGILRASGGRLASGAISWEEAQIEGSPASRIVRAGIAHVPEGRRIQRVRRLSAT